MTADDVRELLRAAVKKAGSQQKYAATLGCSSTIVWSVLNGRRNPGPRMLHALGVRRVVSYEAIPTHRAPYTGQRERHEAIRQRRDAE